MSVYDQATQGRMLPVSRHVVTLVGHDREIDLGGIQNDLAAVLRTLPIGTRLIFTVQAVLPRRSADVEGARA